MIPVENRKPTAVAATYLAFDFDFH